MNGRASTDPKQARRARLGVKSLNGAFVDAREVGDHGVYSTDDDYRFWPHQAGTARA